MLMELLDKILIELVDLSGDNNPATATLRAHNKLSPHPVLVGLHDEKRRSR